MTIEIPKNKILQTTGVSEILGDVVETFNLDLSSNYGAIRTTRMKRVIDSSEGDVASGIDVAVAFEKFNDDYYFVTDDFVYKGGDVLSDDFIREQGIARPTGETSTSISDLAVFNNKLYVSGNNEIMTKATTGSNDGWSTPITSGVTTGSPHLMEIYGDLLYFTDNFVEVKSITTANALNTTTSTIDLGLDNSQWTITMLKASKDRLWIGLLNTVTGKGRVYQWDGETENTPTDYVELDSGVMSGTIFNNIPYIFDANGKLMAYNVGSFKEVARVFKKTHVTFSGADTLVNGRFIHPNGMTVTDFGTILIFFSNEITILNTENKEYTIPSGIYEYDPNIGLYHKYSPSYSSVDGTTFTDYGQQSITRDDVGAIYFDRSSNKALTDNGNIVCGTRYYIDEDVANARYGIFIDDTLDTTQKYGYFITTKLFSIQVSDTWKKIYAIYKKFQDSGDKISIKYRTEDDEPTEATITWTDTETFTTTEDLSDYEEGNEIQVIQGTGSGKLAHIVSITEDTGTYTVALDDTFTGVTGNSKCLVSKWKLSGDITSEHSEQWKALPITGNVNPYIQFKVGMQFTGKNELYKIRTVNEPIVLE
jgi:hypothetical protein